MTLEQAKLLQAGDRFTTRDGQTITVLTRGAQCPDSITYYDNGGNKHAFVTDAWVLASHVEPLSLQLIIDEKNATEERLHVFSAEASELGFQPGHWPNLIRTTLGNRQQFRFDRKPNDEVVIYRQIAGCIELHILND